MFDFLGSLTDYLISGEDNSGFDNAIHNWMELHSDDIQHAFAPIRYILSHDAELADVDEEDILAFIDSYYNEEDPQ